MLRRFVAALAMLCCLLAVDVAHADTLTYSDYSILAGQNVTLSGTALGRREDAGAGEIQLLGINGGTGRLATFCIDVADWLTPSGSFAVGAFLTGSFADQVNALLTHVLPTLGSNGNASAALQVAIWKAEYGAGLTVSGNDPVTNLASAYLGYVTSGQWGADRTMRVAVLDGGGRDQSQAYLTPIPEPATLALLALALFGVVAFRMRHKASRGAPSRPLS